MEASASMQLGNQHVVGSIGRNLNKGGAHKQLPALASRYYDQLPVGGRVLGARRTQLGPTHQREFGGYFATASPTKFANGLLSSQQVGQLGSVRLRAERFSTKSSRQSGPRSKPNGCSAVDKLLAEPETVKRFIADHLTIDQRRFWIETLMNQLQKDLTGPLTKSPKYHRKGNSKDKMSAVIADQSDAAGHTADHVFQVLDANNDGLVSQREFRIWFLTYFLGSESSSRWAKKEDNPQHVQESTSLGPHASPPSASAAQTSSPMADDTSESTAVAATTASGGATAVAQNVRVPWKILICVALRSAVPYVAFGTIDNALMLSCGEWIDSTIAVRFGLATMLHIRSKLHDHLPLVMQSAGLGNTLSCASGVMTGKIIERMCLKSRLVKRYSPRLTPQQSICAEVKNAHMCGAVAGIIFGCFIGMFPLLLMGKKITANRTATAATNGDTDPVVASS